jgi:hypothetical protein
LCIRAIDLWPLERFKQVAVQRIDVPDFAFQRADQPTSKLTLRSLKTLRPTRSMTKRRSASAAREDDRGPDEPRRSGSASAAAVFARPKDLHEQAAQELPDHTEQLIHR